MTFLGDPNPPIDLRDYWKYYYMSRDSIAIQRIWTPSDIGIREL